MGPPRVGVFVQHLRCGRFRPGRLAPPRRERRVPILNVPLLLFPCVLGGRATSKFIAPYLTAQPVQIDIYRRPAAHKGGVYCNNKQRPAAKRSFERRTWRSRLRNDDTDRRAVAVGDPAQKTRAMLGRWVLAGSVILR